MCCFGPGTINAGGRDVAESCFDCHRPYKGDEVLIGCLSSLKATCGDEPQIVVVDNSPSETTRQIVSAYPNAVYVESPGNPGFAGGNNRGLPFCTRDYILLLNNDTIVKSRQSIERLVEFLEAHPACGAVQGSIILPKANDLAGGCGSFLTPFGFQYARGFGIPLDTPGVNVPVCCFSVIGAFMMFPRKILSDAGFLFYDHFKSYYEESDFCHRVWLAGYEVWYVPTEPIEHLCGYTAGMFARTDIMRQHLRNSFFSLKVNLGFASRLVIVSCYYLVMVIHAFVHLLKGDRATFKMDFGMFADVFRLRKEIAVARRNVNRRVSDFRVFRHVLRFPSVSYLFRSSRANL